MVNSPELKLAEKPVPYPYFEKPEDPQSSFLRRAGEAFNRWDATRRINPFIQYVSATGFEGYFVGLGLAPEKVATQIAELGANSLLAIRRLHPHNFSYLKEVWRVANGELYDRTILADLNAYLMANIGRLRVKVHPGINPTGDTFRRGIAKLVTNEHIDYVGEEMITKHKIAIPKSAQPKTAIAASPEMFNTQELKDGYRFMQLLGKAGYPLVQLTIRRDRV